MGHSFVYAHQNTGLLWHTDVRPSVHASYDNISHLFPLLLIGHVVTYIVLIKGGASERCDFSQFGKRQQRSNKYQFHSRRLDPTRVRTHDLLHSRRACQPLYHKAFLLSTKTWCIQSCVYINLFFEI
jgi:hypothetical protein